MGFFVVINLFFRIFNVVENIIYQSRQFHFFLCNQYTFYYIIIINIIMIIDLLFRPEHP